MSELQISFTPENPGAARGPELAATWARLTIRVADECVTQIHDHVARTVTDGICAPMYPLAEWIATNWWPLLNECWTPQRDHEYERRHNLVNASEGFALPNLSVQPMGDWVALAWTRDRRPLQRVDFITAGTALVRREAVVSAFHQFVEGVVSRLSASGLHDTPLQQEWSAILEGTEEELQFAHAAGSIGLDPYDIEDSTSDVLSKASDVLTPDLMQDFLEVVTPSSLVSQLQWINEGIRKSRAKATELGFVSGARQHFKSMPEQTKTPWEQGYEHAKQLRQYLNLGNTVRISLADALIAHGHRVIVDSRFDMPGIEAFAASGKADRVGIVVRKAHEASERFSYCRALYELVLASRSAAVISSATSDRQRRNRAFAAEFLAPVDLVREKITTSAVPSEDIEEIAEDFGVSDFVIRHQIENQTDLRLLG